WTAGALEEAVAEPIVLHPAPASDPAEAPVETLEEADEEAKAGILFPAEPKASPTSEISEGGVSAEALAFAPPAVAAAPDERRVSKRERQRSRFPTAAE